YVCGLVMALPIATASAAISDGEIRIGLVTDMSSVYREIGQGSDIAAEMAIEDYGGKVNGKKIRLYLRDHKVDTKLAMAHAKELHEKEKVDLFLDMAGTDISIAMQHYARENDILAIHTGTASSILTAAECSPLGIHWVYDTYALAGGTAAATIAQGADTWYFITVDYTFGKVLEADATAVIKRNGGKVLGTSLHPLKASDFTAQLAAAMQSGAKVIALASSGRDTNQAIRQAYEFGIGQDGKQMLVGLLVMESAVAELGQFVAQGLKLTTAFYWNYDEQTRAWSARFRARAGTNPQMFHAGVYSALMHYFKAIEATGSDDPKTVIAKMRQMPVNDFFARNGKLRDDGRMVHDMYLLEVKKPEEVTAIGDYYKILQVIPGDKAFRPLEEGGCPYLAKR
ncbi:MAG TPA: ABC transporter substrate-binding protein, partial [Gammaproteobacteria bacterium]|nr:ABC transporter substrate-binding protein [Gammaproteobacteria bacterium]